MGEVIMEGAVLLRGVERARLVDILTFDNPHARKDQICLYADAVLDYREAETNIRENGNVVLHPRTGTPIENPYIKVKAAAARQLLALGKVKNVGRVWTC